MPFDDTLNVFSHTGLYYSVPGRFTLQGIKFARKEKWKNGQFWRSAEFAKNEKYKKKLS